MLHAPRFRQPDAYSCSPAAVWSVLRYQGYEVEFEEIVAACRLGDYGVLQEIAIQGLSEAGWSVDVLAEADPAAIRAALDEDRPVIVSVEFGRVGGVDLAHAVVVCELDEETAIVMDPQVGDYKSLPARALLLRSGHGLVGPLLIGAATR